MAARDDGAVEGRDGAAGHVGPRRPALLSARRIAIVGNAGGGKTTLARRLGASLDLPVTHVDSVQFQPNWQRTARIECDRMLDDVASRERWIIDGFGSDDVIERRIARADTLI